MFKIGDRVRLNDNYEYNNMYEKGETYTIKSFFGPYVTLDKGLMARETGERAAENGWYAERFELAVPVENDKQAEFVKAKDEVLSKVEDVLEGLVETILDKLNDLLDKAAPRA